MNLNITSPQFSHSKSALKFGNSAATVQKLIREDLANKSGNTLILNPDKLPSSPEDLITIKGGDPLQYIVEQLKGGEKVILDPSAFTGSNAKPQLRIKPADFKPSSNPAPDIADRVRQQSGYFLDLLENTPTPKQTVTVLPREGFEGEIQSVKDPKDRAVGVPLGDTLQIGNQPFTLSHWPGHYDN